MSDQKMKNKNLALIAGILAIGVLAASIVATATASGQASSAAAQQPAAKSSSINALEVVEDCPRDAEVCAQEMIKHWLNHSSVVSTAGTATVKVKPDKVTVSVGVETEGKTAAEAVAENARIMDQVLAALDKLGIREDQISTSYYSVYPLYEWKHPPCIAEDKVRPEIYPPPPECQPRNEIVGYRASNSLSVTLDVADSRIDVGKVIDSSVGAGANNISGAYFFVSEERQQEIRDSLIEEAMVNARNRAEKAAAAAGMKISGVQSISLGDVFFPVVYKDFVQEANGARVSTQILPGQQEISMSVHVTFFMS